MALSFKAYLMSHIYPPLAPTPPPPPPPTPPTPAEPELDGCVHVDFGNDPNLDLRTIRNSLATTAAHDYDSQSSHTTLQSRKHTSYPLPEFAVAAPPPSTTPISPPPPVLPIRPLQYRFQPSLVLENCGSVARDHLATERTFLAYVRTSLTIASTGVGAPSSSIQSNGSPVITKI